MNHSLASQAAVPDRHDRTGASRTIRLCLGEEVEVVAELGRGAQSAVYRVRRGGTDYALKILQRPILHGERVGAAFCREAALLARVDHPGVPKVFDVGITDGRPYLVLEFLDGQPLAELLETGLLGEPALVRLAADVAAALAAAHRAGLVHRDVKPANIVMTADGRARVIDFGLAATERTAPDDGAVVGTFQYSAPEQTGMLARPVDGRADLYSLGVVLFRCATGVLPFVADDAGELIAMHASLPAPDPRSLRPELSPETAEIIVRLLAKDPDDRFQSAGELLAALARLAAAPTDAITGWAAQEATQPLAGRDGEQATLAARWGQARSGHGGIVLISGAPGSGKTSLAQAVVEVARADGAVVLSGKCDADSALPLAALRSAVETYLRGLGTLPADGQEAAVRRMRAAAGQGASLLRPLSPALAVMLDAPTLAEEDRHEQFAGAVASFLAALAALADGAGNADGAGGAGGVLVLDDVQWMDAASRVVLRRLVEEISEVPLLVVATVRNDAASRDGLRAFEDAVGTAVDLRVPIGPLDHDATTRLVGRYLSGSAVGQEVIAELSTRGQGNPFTILEYLRALIDAGALRPSWGTWRLDAHVLQALELPNDVLDLVLARVDGLGDGHRELLTAAAAIGHTVDTGLLAEVAGVDPAAALAEAADRGLVHLVDDGYTFVHDRIREALLSAVGAADRRSLHQRIATVLDRQQRTDAAGVYATARHYASGETDRTPERVFVTGWAAGQLALEENAPDAALVFLESADAAARRAGVSPDSRFHEALGVAYWSTGRIEPARRQLEAGLATETRPVRRAALLLQLSHVLRTGWELTRSVTCAREGLAELGAAVPENPVRFGRATARVMLHWLVLGNRPPADRPARGEEAERLRLRVLLCRSASAAVAINLKPGQVVAFNLFPESFAYRLGTSGDYLTHLSGVGSIAGTMGLRKRRDSIYRRAKEIAEKLGDPKAYANAAWYEGFSKLLGNEVMINEWADVCETHRRWLEVDFYTNILLMRCRDLVQRGYATEAVAWLDRGRSRIRTAATADTFPGFAILDSMTQALLGRSSDAPAALAARAAQPLDAGHGIQFMLGAAQTALEHDELGEPFESTIAAFDRLGLSLSAIFTEYRMIYAYFAFGWLVRFQRALDADRAARTEELARTRGAVRALRRAATKTGPAASPLALTLLNGYSTVAEASLLQLQGQHEKALDRLARDETALVRLDAPLVGYEAARVRARALIGLGEQQSAARQAGVAYTLAAEHGWSRRARWVRTEFGEAGVMSHGGATPRGTTPRGYAGPRQPAAPDPYRRRLEALLQVSTAAAKVLDTQQLARVALDETLRILGAERAILFLVDERDGLLRPTLGRDATGADLAALSGYSSTLVDRVAVDRQPLVVTGSEEGAALGSSSAVVYGLRSIMIAPLELDGRLTGVVYLDSRVAKGVFTDADIGILTAITSHIAASLSTARAAELEVAVQRAREQRDTAEVLRSAMNAFAATLYPDQVLEKLLGMAARAVPADRLCLLHRDGPDLITSSLGPVDLTGVDAEDLLGRVAPGHGDRRTAPAAVAALLTDANSWLATPVNTRGHGRGVLIAGSCVPGGFTGGHVDLVSALVGQAATAYDNARLFARVQQLATRDDLTGACNRRHFTELANRQLGVARRNRRPLSAMMIDIDHFKQVNDTYGHAAGDEVLRAVAQILQAHVREPDVCCRYGGEEFAVVQSEMHGDPMEVGERLRAAVAAYTVVAGDQRISITVSIGVAEMKVDDDLDALLGRADEALYRAKKAGRNQVKAG